MKNTNIVITSAFRTAIGSFGGALAHQAASHLGSLVIKKCLEHSELKSVEVDMVYMGQVLTTGTGQNPARQAAIHAGISKEKTATTINQVCGSGLAAVALAYNSIKCEDGAIMIAGGQESMSNSPHYIHVRDGIKMGDGKIKDSMVIDGLWDIYNQYHMGITAENVAKKFNISRKQQDEFAALSQKRTHNAIVANKFKDEIVPIEIRVKKSNDNTVGELRLITKTLITELSKNTQVNIENNKKLNANLGKLNRSNSKTISKAINQISNKAIYKQIVANQAIQAQQISRLVKQNNNVLGKIADKTSRIKYP